MTGVFVSKSAIEAREGKDGGGEAAPILALSRLNRTPSPRVLGVISTAGRNPRVTFLYFLSTTAIKP